MILRVGTALVTEGLRLVVDGAKDEHSDDEDGDKDSQYHDGEDAGGPLGGLGRGLSDPKGVNEGSREEEEGFHQTVQPGTSPCYQDFPAQEMDAGMMHPDSSKCIYLCVRLFLQGLAAAMEGAYT